MKLRTIKKNVGRWVRSFRKRERRWRGTHDRHMLNAQLLSTVWAPPGEDTSSEDQRGRVVTLAELDLLAELEALLRAQVPPTGDYAGTASLLVAPDVWEKFVATVPPSTVRPAWSLAVVVNRMLPDGMVIPLDRDGKPIPRPTRTAPPASEGVR